MRKINFVVPPGVNSFYYSAKYAISWIDPSQYFTSISNSYAFGRINIVVDDMWNQFRRPKKGNIYWLDTPLEYDMHSVPLQSYKPREIWVASTWNLEICRRYFGDKCKYQPRLIHPLYIYNGLKSPAYNYDKKWDMAFIGVCWWRKYCREFKRICQDLNLKCWMTGDYNKIETVVVIEQLKRTKLLWWLTGAEGFGLPLIEAEVLGVLPVCIDAHANMDYCYTSLFDKTLVLDPTGRKVVDDITGRHNVWLFDYEEAKRLIKDMLDMDWFTYTDIAYKISDIAISHHKQWVEMLLNRLKTI